MSEPLCPMTRDGLHKKRVWQDKITGQSGLSCRYCHKTWHHTEQGAVETWKHLGWSTE